jgi:DNA repair protein RadC
MKIKDLPEQNRPRERFLKHGPEVLSDSELFAIILRTGSQKENVIDMSNRLIKEYGLNNLFDCSLKELQKIRGIGPSKAMQILAMTELGKRYSQSKNPIKKIIRPEDVFYFFHDKLKDKKQEEFWILTLNNQNIITKEELIFRGTIDSTNLHPREIFRPAIKNSASKIILLHNHPSGDAFPSGSDLKTTEKLKELGEKLGIKVVDHVIIAKENGWSCENNKRLCL